MATHSSILAWRTPMDREPGRFIGLQRVGHGLMTILEKLIHLGASVSLPVK